MDIIRYLLRFSMPVPPIWNYPMEMLCIFKEVFGFKFRTHDAEICKITMCYVHNALCMLETNKKYKMA